MQVCAQCQRPQNSSKKFCTGCGARFPASGASFPAGPQFDDELADDRNSLMAGRPAPLPRPRPTAAIATGIVIVMLAAGGAGLWWHGRHSSVTTPGSTGRALTGATQSGPANQPASGLPSSSSLEPSPAQSAAGPVTITGSAAQNPGAQAIAAFLGQYFSAINAHDYQTYISLLSPAAQQNFTEAQFQDGYASTTDSAETLVDVSTAADGDTVAAVTFTSSQTASQSVNQADTCTDWGISLYLGQNSGSYVIDPPPPGYQASHSSCP